MEERLNQVENKKPKCWEYVFVDVRFRVFVMLCFAIFISLGVPYMLMIQLITSKTQDQVGAQCLLEHELRISCFPGKANEHQSKEACEKMECCWEEFESSVPNCFHSHPTKHFYMLKEINQSSPNVETLKLSLGSSNESMIFPAEKTIYVSVQHWSKQHLRILIHRKSSFDPLTHLDYLDDKRGKDESHERDYQVSYSSKGEWFHINVSRRLGSHQKRVNLKPIFNTIYGPLIVSDEMSEITTLLPSYNIFGIGQNSKTNFRYDLRRHKHSTLFSGEDFDYENSATFAMAAGVHPFYMITEKTGLAHGVLFLSTLPGEIVTSGAPAVTFRAGDGRLDFHIFLGPKPADVIKQLVTFIGLPVMPPYWALGYHSCRNTLSIENAIEYLKYTEEREILHESDCGSTKLFDLLQLTNSLQLKLSSFKNALNKAQKRFVLFQAPYLALPNQSLELNSDQNAYEVCKNESSSLYVRNSDNIDSYVGYSQDDIKVGFVDFFKSGTIGKWLHCILRVTSSNPITAFDGISLNFNTPLNADLSDTSIKGCHEAYNVSHFSPSEKELNNGTICMNARHVGNQRHVYLHNIYGYKHMLEVRRTLQGISKNTRWFITSLSTFSGSGRHGGHWGGFLNATWSSLKRSIIQMLDFSIFGMPLVGSPACGSYGKVDEDLCSRWLQVAAFQPLMFTHRTDDIEPLLNNSRLTTVARDMIRLRYSLHPFLYSLFYNASKLGHAVARPLMLEFSEHPQANAIDEQFMWGSALLVSPVLRPSVQKIISYFPPGCWYDYYTGKIESDSTEGVFKELIAFRSRINLHIRGGHVIPGQTINITNDRSTADTRRHGLTITIALNCNSEAFDVHRVIAYGELFIDDGHSMHSVAEGNYLLVSITAKKRFVEIFPLHGNLQSETSASISRVLNVVHIYGMAKKPKKLFVNGNEREHTYNMNLNSAMIKGLNLDLYENHTIYWET